MDDKGGMQKVSVGSVEFEKDRLTKAISDLQDKTSFLADSLASVLSEPPPQACDPKTDCEPQCVLAHDLRNMATNVENITATLGDLKERNQL